MDDDANHSSENKLLDTSLNEPSMNEPFVKLDQQNATPVKQNVASTPSSINTITSHSTIEEELERIEYENDKDTPQFKYVVLTLGGRLNAGIASFIIDMISDSAGVFSVVLKGLSKIIGYVSAMSRMYELTNKYIIILKDLQKNVELMKILYAIINSSEHPKIEEQLKKFTHPPTEQEFNEIFMIPEEITNINHYLEEINEVITMYVFPKTIGYSSKIPGGKLVLNNILLVMSELNELFGLLTLSYSLANTQFISTLSSYTMIQIEKGEKNINDKIREVLNKLAEGNNVKNKKTSRTYDLRMEEFKEAVNSDAELKQLYDKLLSLGEFAQKNNLTPFYEKQTFKFYNNILIGADDSKVYDLGKDKDGNINPDELKRVKINLRNYIDQISQGMHHRKENPNYNPTYTPQSPTQTTAKKNKSIFSIFGGNYKTRKYNTKHKKTIRRKRHKKTHANKKLK